MYVVTFADFPMPLDHPDDIKRNLDSGRNLALQNTKGTLVAEKEITVNNHPGREIRVKMTGARMSERIFVVDHRMYQVAVVLPEIESAAEKVKPFQESSAAYFLNSFKLNPK